MAMTKAERAAFDAAQADARIARALRWSEPTEPDLPIPTEGATSGWAFWPPTMPDVRQVEQAWSERTAHGYGVQRTPWRSGSQNGVPLYSTRLRALLALRGAYERVFAHVLDGIDAEIAKERGA